MVAMGALQLLVGVVFLCAAYQRLDTVLPHAISRWDWEPAQLKKLFGTGTRLLILNLMGFAVTNFGLFVVERRFGLAVLTPYAAMTKLGALLATLGGLIPNMTFTYVTRYHAQGNHLVCRRYYLAGVALSVATVAIFAFPIYWLRYEIFELWLGDTHLLQSSAFLYILMFSGMLAHHTAQAMPTLAVAGHTFMLPAIANGLLVAGLSVLLSGLLGTEGVPLAMILGTLVPTSYVTWIAMRTFLKAPVP
jgi:O-antigen/teichoic acid export membrane protein